MFGIHGSAIGHDFIHLARTVASDELRSAIDSALQGRPSTITQFVAAGDSTDGRARWLEVRAHRLAADGRGGPPGVCVMVEDVTETRAGMARVAGDATPSEASGSASRGN